MTKNTGPSRGFFLNAERCGGGMRISLGGVVSVAEFSEECVLLITHSGKIRIFGRGLLLSVFEGRGTEISGRIGGVEFIYGKN